MSCFSPRIFTILIDANDGPSESRSESTNSPRIPEWTFELGTEFIRRPPASGGHSGGHEHNFEVLCLVNVSVKYFSKLCFGTIKIQPELKYLKPILEDFTFLFQRAKALEQEFGRVPSISSIFTGSKMARICKGTYYKYFMTLQCQVSSLVRGFAPSSVGPGFISSRDFSVTTYMLHICMHFITQIQ